MGFNINTLELETKWERNLTFIYISFEILDMNCFYYCCFTELLNLLVLIIIIIINSL